MLLGFLFVRFNPHKNQQTYLSSFVLSLSTFRRAIFSVFLVSLFLLRYQSYFANDVNNIFSLFWRILLFRHGQRKHYNNVQKEVVREILCDSCISINVEIQISTAETKKIAKTYKINISFPNFILNVFVCEKKMLKQTDRNKEF